jgi:hypothetical protein
VSEFVLFVRVGCKVDSDHMMPVDNVNAGMGRNIAAYDRGEGRCELTNVSNLRGMRRLLL